MRVLPLIALLAGCTSSDGVAFLVEYEDILFVLDDETASQSWDVRVEVDASAERSGTTRATLRVDGVAIVPEPPNDYDPVTVAASLEGGGADDNEIWFPTPGRGAIRLLDHQDVACTLGEPCSWAWSLTIERALGAGDVGLELQARGLLTLGYDSDAPPDAFMRLTVEEIDGEPGDTGM